jgi:ribosome-associated protein
VVTLLLEDSQARALFLAQALEEARALDIVVLDVRDSLTVCDYFVVCHTRSSVHAEAVVEKVREQARAAHLPLHHREGAKRGEWVILDYVDVVVHIFSESARGFYNLERLRHDAQVVPWEPARGGAQAAPTGANSDGSSAD